MFVRWACSYHIFFFSCVLLWLARPVSCCFAVRVLHRAFSRFARHSIKQIFFTTYRTGFYACDFVVYTSPQRPCRVFRWFCSWCRFSWFSSWNHCEGEHVKPMHVLGYMAAAIWHRLHGTVQRSSPAVLLAVSVSVYMPLAPHKTLVVHCSVNGRE